ncbi:3-oxoacyl-[acyl-carrier-protein] reductase [Tenericutes bacterium MZ-XQ]|jgi:3-oxoacyl-[acyl-carrier protein] reductase|nr:3-oxoacyl-[acyl-carrier-protein] reductase [Tenericutes bacterium MZ-XQ]
MNLQNKVAIVTGGAAGIGRTISLELAKHGAKVVINYRSSEAKALELVEEIKSLGSDALAIKADISDFNQAKTLVDETINVFGQLDILVNNAGITKDQLILRMQEEQFDQVMDTNLKGSWNMAKHAARPLLKSNQGRIINISSIIGLIGNVGQTNYSASKAGMIGLTKSLAKEFGTKGVTANAICPGFIETEMTKNLDPKFVEAYLNNIPLKRLGQPIDVANAVVYLASNLASYMTGQVLVIDGGMVM